MKRVFAAAAIATVLAGLPVLALATEQAVEGTVQSVDHMNNTITLVGGETFTVPANVSTEQVVPDEQVTIIYQGDLQNGQGDRHNGDPVATAIFIDRGTEER